MTRPLLRDVVGFLTGGVLAALLSCAVFLVFFPLPPQKPRDYTREVLAMLVLVNFLCGAFVGWRALRASGLSDLLLSLGGTYAVMVFVGVLASLDFWETASMIGLASTGLVPSAAGLFLLGRRFPRKVESYEL